MRRFPGHKVNAEIYERLRREDKNRVLTEKFIVPVGTGKGFVVNKGQILRIIQVEGPQCCDFNAFNLHNPKEMFWSGRTRILQGAHLTAGDQLWSTPPKMRPMFTIIEDTVARDAKTGKPLAHDLLFARCNERYFEVLLGEGNRPNCQDNLSEAIKPFGLSSDYVHDAFNMFTKTGIDENDRLFFYEGTDAKKGDYVDLFAEMDCIIALSACPGAGGLKQRGMNRPLGVEIYKCADLKSSSQTL